MGRKFPPATHTDAEKVALHLGFRKMKNNQTSGSHGQHKHPQTGRKVTIPKYKEPYYSPLFAKICKQLDVNKKEFYEILKNL